MRLLKIILPGVTLHRGKNTSMLSFDGFDASTMQQRTHGTLLMRRRNDEKYIYETWARISNIQYGGSTRLASATVETCPYINLAMYTI